MLCVIVLSLYSKCKAVFVISSWLIPITVAPCTAFRQWFPKWLVPFPSPKGGACCLQEALRPSPHTHQPLSSPVPQGRAGSAQHCPGLQFQGYLQKPIYPPVLDNLFYLVGEWNKLISHKASEKGIKTWCNCLLRSWMTNNAKYVISWVDGGKGFSAWQHCQLLMAAHLFLILFAVRFDRSLEHICPCARVCSAGIHCMCNLLSTLCARKHPGTTPALPQRIIFCIICDIFD